MSARRKSSRSQQHLLNAKINQAVSWSFSRDRRFKANHKPVNTEYSTKLSPTISRRAAAFGYGKRWEPRNFTGQDSPPPTAYRCKSVFDVPKISGKIDPPHNRFKKIKNEAMPGPGTYEVRQPIGKDAPMISLKSRIHRRQHSETPSPGEYRPYSVLTEHRRFHDISFGIGERKLYNIDNTSPGPGTYDQPSTFRSTPIHSRAATPSRPVSSLGFR